MVWSVSGTSGLKFVVKVRVLQGLFLARVRSDLSLKVLAPIASRLPGLQRLRRRTPLPGACRVPRPSSNARVPLRSLAHRLANVGGVRTTDHRLYILPATSQPFCKSAGDHDCLGKPYSLTPAALVSLKKIVMMWVHMQRP